MPMKNAKCHICLIIFALFCVVNVSLSDENGFYTMTHNRSANNVLNSFGVHTAFIATIADDARAQKIQEKWKYFVQRFEHSYEFIPTLKNMMAREQIPQEFYFLLWQNPNLPRVQKALKKP